jgi:putative membrane protein
MRFSKILLGSISIILFATFGHAVFAKEKNHDGEIIAYMEAINNSEINAGKLAKDKKVDDDVMKFADMMIDQHGENLNQVTDLSTKLNIAPDETIAVKNFKKNDDKDLEKLSKLDDAKFQKAYIHAMIKGHMQADKMLTHFIKEVQNSDLKDYLVNTKTAVEQHLADAKELK